jgi:hypothetical protein
MRKLYFLVPGTTQKFACGGLWAELKTLQLAQQICDAEIVTYRQREKETLFLNDLLQQSDRDDAIFVVSWGFDVVKQVNQLQSYNVTYHAHSAGYGFRLPSSIPIITVSRNTLGYWGQKAPNSLIYYLPNQISEEFRNQNLEREIDVLVHVRKSSSYLLRQLIPALQQHCNLQVIEGFVSDLAGLFNRTKVYLYDSAEYWAVQGVSEGFGLQPLEAMACGCQVFSSVNSGLADYLDPGFNCHKISGYSKEYDVQRILKVLTTSAPPTVPDDFVVEYRTDNITKRLRVILGELNEFFDHKAHYPSSIQNLTAMRIAQLRLEISFKKIKKILSGK